jgi:hypothetical protein
MRFAVRISTPPCGPCASLAVQRGGNIRPDRVMTRSASYIVMGIGSDGAILYKPLTLQEKTRC